MSIIFGSPEANVLLAKVKAELEDEDPLSTGERKDVEARLAELKAAANQAQRDIDSAAWDLQEAEILLEDIENEIATVEAKLEKIPSEEEERAAIERWNAWAKGIGIGIKISAEEQAIMDQWSKSLNANP